VWSVDGRGNLSVIRQYRKKGEITTIAFCSLTPKFEAPVKGKGGDLKLPAYSPSFFLGTDRGSIIFADDAGHCTDVQQLSSAIDVLLFFEEKSRLVVVTRSLLLTQYFLSDEGKLSRVMQVKLSVSGDISERGIRSFTWTVPGVLAISTEERVVRFFDLISDEHYNISLHNALGGFVDRSDRISCVAFNPVDRYLSVGTFAGIIAIWKFIGPIREVNTPNPYLTSPQDWEVSHSLLEYFVLCFTFCF
jgi:intraflagellar transport protein 140